MKKFNIIALFIFFSVISFSCTEDDITIEEPNRKEFAKSYAETFQLFWETMDTKYNYFYEEKETRGLDWDAVYDEYYPKFEKLKTFGDKKANSEVALKELQTAVNYFYEIINPLLDRHLGVEVTFKTPTLSNDGYSVYYKTGRENNNLYANFPYNYSPSYQNRLKRNQILNNIETKIDFGREGVVNITDLDSEKKPIHRSIYGGFLKGADDTRTDIYYFNFKKFNLNTKDLRLDKYKLKSTLKLNTVNSSLLPNLNKQQFDRIENLQLRNYTIEYAKKLRNHLVFEIKQIINSREYALYLNELNIFLNTEKMELPILENADKLIAKIKHVYSEMNKLDAEHDSEIYKYQNDKSIKEADISNHFKIIIKVISNNEEIKKLYELDNFNKNLEYLKTVYPLYHNFYNKLTDGSIKKIIIDLRENRGGAVMDFRTFTERFITQEKVYSYQRTKEGNGRFNYTPWAPNKIAPHPFGIPSNIPIVLLTNKGSVSMSEMSTMAIKTQGSLVKVVGNYSKGATAGLTDNGDEFNGGIKGTSGNVYFYMPTMALKNTSKNIVEAIGNKPDLLILPSDQEIKKLGYDPKIKDSVFEAALTLIKKM